MKMMRKCGITRKWLGCHNWLLRRMCCYSDYSATPEDDPDDPDGSDGCADKSFDGLSNDREMVTNGNQVQTILPRYEIE